MNPEGAAMPRFLFLRLPTPLIAQAAVQATSVTVPIGWQGVWRHRVAAGQRQPELARYR